MMFTELREWEELANSRNSGRLAGSVPLFTAHLINTAAVFSEKVRKDHLFYRIYLLVVGLEVLYRP
jgi:hypothetical protein